MDAITPAHIPPLDEGNVDECFRPLTREKLLLAVSGGPDSIALMGLVAGWSGRRGEPQPAVAVVDHGLRAESAREALFVTQSAEALGLSCAVLTWTGPKPQTGLQEAARTARYQLLADHAHAIGATALVTGHTLDDQAETLLMRLSRGSGPSGMAGMRVRTTCLGLPLIRPLLGISKQRLIATCDHHGWRWTFDPSNSDRHFARVRWRTLMPTLAGEGLTAERLGLFAQRMAQADEALDDIAHKAFIACTRSNAGAGLQLDARQLCSHPPAVVYRVLAIILDRVAVAAPDEANHPTQRLQRIEAYGAALIDACQDRQPLRRTLGGLLFNLDGAGVLDCRPETKRRRGCVNPVQGLSLGNGQLEN